MNKKSKDANRNVVATISHNEYKDILLNDKCLRHSINRIQTKDCRVEICEIKTFSLSCFDDKVYIEINRYETLTLGY